MGHPEVAVALIGACGEVGRVAAVQLAMHSGSVLRAGARNLNSAARLIDRIRAPRAQPMRVDLYDEASLQRFCAECTIVVNCAGPSHLVSDRVARAARAAAEHYVDAAADLELHDRVRALQFDATRRSALIGAGMQPGLSEMLPRIITRDFDPGATLTVHAGGLDHMTDTAAEDYMQLLRSDFGAINTIWLDGRPAALPSGTSRSAPPAFFPAGATAVPFLSHDAARLAKRLCLRSLQWFTVFPGRHMYEALSLAQLRTGSLEPAAAGRILARAAELDLFGHQPCQLFVLELAGSLRGEPRHRMLVCRGHSATELTGLMVARTVLEVLEGTTPTGVGFAADALAPEGVLAWLRAVGGIVATEIEDGPQASWLEQEMGIVA